MGYSRAIGSIKAHRGPIKEANDLEGIPGVGKAIKEKVTEWFDSGKINKLENLKSAALTQSVETLSGVHGVGPATALKLYQRGIKTIEDLRKH